MTRVALKGLAARRLRAALTALAIVLGVALVAGTYVLTDSITGAFTSIYQNIYRGTDASITGRNAIGAGVNGSVGASQAAPSFSQSLLTQIRALPDVRQAVGDVGGSVQLIKNGHAISFGGAPTLGTSVEPKYPQFTALHLVSGHWPGPQQVVVDTSTASRKQLRPGQSIGVQGLGQVQTMQISGLVRFGPSNAMGGATLAGFQLATAQRLTGKIGRLDGIRVSARAGVSPSRLVAEIRPVLPSNAQVRTGTQEANSQAADVNNFLSTFRTILLVFAGVALFVGSFVIANSLSITIAQRTREFATLRTLGATRRQVLRSILLESLVLGVVASAVGLFAGLGLANGLFSLFNSVGLTLPNSGTLVRPRTVIVALVVGILVTVLASLRPAMRATRVEPIAAVREGATLPEGRLAHHRTALSAAATGLGFVAVILGLFAVSGTGVVLALMGAGAILVFVGIALLSSRFVPFMAEVLGWPGARLGGAMGRLARENTRRNPQRTASTASALMIGLALVTLLAMMSAGIISNFKGAVNSVFTGDYAITAQNGNTPIPIAAGEAAARAPGALAAGSVRAGEGRLFGYNTLVSAVNPDIGRVIRLNWIHGSPAVFGSLGINGAFLDQATASANHLHVGSVFTVETPAGGRIGLTVRGVFKPPTGGSPFGAVTMSTSTWDRYYSQPQNIYTLVKMRGGVTPTNTAALKRTVASYPNAKVQTRRQFIDNQVANFTALLNVLYVLLALSILVSLFGIVNTLILSVFERTREIGMLRAVGTTRRQIRSLVRQESVITALIGSVIGITLGVVFGALLAARESAIAFTIPVTSLIVFVFAAWLVGLVAAIFPARRAARLAPLQALAYE